MVKIRLFATTKTALCLNCSRIRAEIFWQGTNSSPRNAHVAGRHVDEGPAERGDHIADVDLLAHAGCGALYAVRLQRTLQPCHHLADLLRESAASCHSRRKISQPGGLWRLRSNRSSRGKDLFLVSWNLFDDGASTSMQGSSQQIGTRRQDSITNKMRGPFIVTGRGLLRTA